MNHMPCISINAGLLLLPTLLAALARAGPSADIDGGGGVCGLADEPARLYSSTCDGDTDWNYRNVSGALMDWVYSIKVDPYEMPTDIALSFHEEGLDDGRTHLDFIGRVNRRGFAVGPFWTSGGFSEGSPFNNGFMFGQLDENGEMTGNNIVFVYPDMRTVLYGNFSGNRMASAKASKIVAERCRKGLKRILLAKPADDAPVYRYAAGSETRVTGGQPTLVDPYERRTVYIGDVAGIGEGLFAKRDVRKGELFAYYAGMVYNVTERPIYQHNMSALDYERIHKNVITLTEDLWMNLPYELWTLDKFRASLAHKINHSFKKANCQFVTVFNARFGVVRGTEATRDVKSGEQFFVEYGYPIEDMYPPWYVDLYLQEVGPLPKDKIAKEMQDADDLEDEENGNIVVDLKELKKNRKIGKRKNGRDAKKA